MKSTSTLKALILGTAVTTLFAAEAFAQANHNTSRSNKTPGGIAAPADTGTLVGSETDAAKKATDNQGHVTLVKSANCEGGRKDVTIGRESCELPSSSGNKPSLTDCVTETGAVDANCDGVADADQVTTKIDDPRRIRKRPEPRQQRR